MQYAVCGPVHSGFEVDNVEFVLFFAVFHVLWKYLDRFGRLCAYFGFLGAAHNSLCRLIADTNFLSWLVIENTNCCLALVSDFTL